MGKVSRLSFTLPRSYKNGFQTALLRAASLVLFKCFGYEYAKHEIVQVIRRCVCDRSLQQPRLRSLIFEAQDCEMPFEEAHIVVPGNMNGVEFFLVIIRVRKATTSLFGVYMPVPADRSEEFFDLMEQCARDHDGMTLTIPTQGIFT